MLAMNRIIKKQENKNFPYSTPIFAELLHEYLGHFNKRIKDNSNTPRKCIYQGELIEDKEETEAGRIIEHYIGSKEQVLYLKSVNNFS